MAASHLLTIAEVVEAMGQNPDLVDAANPAILSAIERAVTKLETLLDTSLLGEEVVDTFIVGLDDAVFMKGLLRLRLANGVLRADRPLTVTMYSEDLSRATPIDPDVCLVDMVRGVIQVPVGFVPANCRVVVQYTSGYVAADAAEGAQNPVPKALKQALLHYTPMLLLSSQSAQADTKQQAAQVTRATTLDGMAEQMAVRFMRYLGACAKPVHTERAEYAPA